jgi:hypothetical protein
MTLGFSTGMQDEVQIEAGSWVPHREPSQAA